MPSSLHNNLPLVSVIIPCYNHGKYLAHAVESIRQQDYKKVEIIVVDDGSSDNTKQVAEKCNDVLYIYQHNQGLSAARNTGIKNSHGEFMIFLDADDWLLSDAISYNVDRLVNNEKLAFVSGGHNKVFVDENITREDVTEVLGDHYCNLLRGNYIGMHATVMYRKWIFNEMQFDPSLKMCEDYDLYLKIARKFPVAHHTAIIAAYRLHTQNMSNNIPKMLSTVLAVLQKQKSNLGTQREKQAFLEGKKIWKNYYTKELYNKLVANKIQRSFKNILSLMKLQPVLFIKLLARIFNHDKKSNKKPRTLFSA